MPASAALRERTLVQDIAGLTRQIEAAAFLAGARLPKYRLSVEQAAMRDSFDMLFQQLFESVYAVLYKAIDGYPDAQDWPRKRSRRK